MDLFRLPAVRTLSRWRHTRLVLQLILLGAAVAVVAHGLLGPPIAPRNAATVFTWVHYRGLLIVALLAVGNLFCTACPMILVRDGVRRLAHPALRWPARLRGKWLALVLFAGVLYAYELFDLWALPRATAWLVVGYFGVAVAIDTIFAGASFCRYVCPIGQFNFTASLMSPAELQVRDGGTCRSCRTADCIKGTPPGARPGIPAAGQRGCELGLFLPAKVGNMDCTLCLDCVRACPHDNIGLVTRVPGLELLDTRRRSGIGRLARRPDIAALAVLFTFGALLNAFAMTAPAVRAEAALARALSIESPAILLGAVFLAGLIVLPAALLGGAAALARRLAPGSRHRSAPARALAIRHAYALVPLGLGIWAAHYGFHFLTGMLTAVPVAQSAAIDLFGRAVLGEPAWRWTGLTPGSVFAIQLGLLLLGAIGSAGLAVGLSQGGADRPWRAAAPWLGVVALLAVAAAWVFAQPMDMRGVGFAG